MSEHWEWEPSLLQLRVFLERLFEQRLRLEVDGGPAPGGDDTAAALRTLVAEDDGPPLSHWLQGRGSREQFREFVIHRSAYQLKEADPHSWAIPRLEGRAKAALVEIQTDEYGSGAPERMHSTLFRATMEALGLDGRYGAYLDRLPGVTLATVNLMSLFGLNRRWRGAVVGHLALFEMTSSAPNRRYGNGLRRLGYGPEATGFYDEHVEADSVHEVIAAHDMAGSLAAAEPRLVPDILFGARCLLFLENRFARHLLTSWEGGTGSLRRRPEPSPGQ